MIKASKIFAAFILFSCSASVWSQEFILSMDVPSATVGRPERVMVTVLNDTNEPYHVPAQLTVRVGRSAEGTLTMLNRAQETVPAGGFRQIVYALNVPASVEAGAIEIVLLGHVSTPILIEFNTEEVEDCILDTPIVDDPVEGSVGKRRLLDGLKTYEPIYFIGGYNPTDAKFQISLKYQLFNENAPWVKRNYWLRGFHLGYTQVSFWDLSSPSKPFEDTNFKPEVFYGLEGLEWDFLPDGSDVDLQLGFLHESNGRDGDNSRSLNILYSRATYRQAIRDGWFAAISSDLWSYVGSIDDNPDIAKYRGHSSLRLTAGKDDGVQLSAYRRGKIWSGKSSYLLDLTFPLVSPGATKKLNFNIHAQLFTGYRENLLTYREKETRLRIGLGIHR